MEKVSEEMLMAYADGELEAPERDRIAALAVADPTIAARIARYGRSAGAARDAFSAIHAEPVPAALVAGVLGRPASTTGQDNGSWRKAMGPIAASLVVISGLAGYLVGSGETAPDETSFLAAATSAPVLSALAATESGVPVHVDAGGHEVAAVATGTYPVGNGMCRIFEATGQNNGVRGVTCLTGDAWSVPVVVSTGAGAYRTASDTPTVMIDAFLDEVGAGADIGAEAEAALIVDNWQP